MSERESGPVVRPYALTGGRTRPGRDYPLEALVMTSLSWKRGVVASTPEARSICELCRHSTSVAEVAARLDMPLGVARVLVGDLAEAGLVIITEPSADGPDSALLERVLSGLRSL